MLPAQVRARVCPSGGLIVEQARTRGANAVLMFRFDVTEAADVGTEVCAYGTAVVLTRE